MVMFFSALRSVFDKMSVILPSEKTGIKPGCLQVQAGSAVVPGLNRGILDPAAAMAIPAAGVVAQIGVKKSIPPRGARRDAERT